MKEIFAKFTGFFGCLFRGIKFAVAEKEFRTVCDKSNTSFEFWTGMAGWAFKHGAPLLQSVFKELPPVAPVAGEAKEVETDAT